LSQTRGEHRQIDIDNDLRAKAAEIVVETTPRLVGDELEGHGLTFGQTEQSFRSLTEVLGKRVDGRPKLFRGNRLAFTPGDKAVAKVTMSRNDVIELAAREGAVLTVGDLMMDEDSREVRRDNDVMQLTATEFELLRFLMRNPRRVLSKAQILDRVWNYDFGGQSNVVELYISYLRRKIDAGARNGDSDVIPLIHTVRGVGYVLRPPRD